MLAWHKVVLAAAVLAWPLVWTPRAAADPQTFIYLWSDPGDYVGGGQVYFRDLSNGRFSTPNAFDRDGDGAADYVEFFWLGNTPGEFVTLSFGTNQIPGTDFAPRLPRPGTPGWTWAWTGAAPTPSAESSRSSTRNSITRRGARKS
jgi:hypothetical protein